MKAVFALLFSLLWASVAMAHEIRPAIGDFEVNGEQLVLTITLNGEALAANANLDGVEDSNTLDSSDQIDSFRAMPPADLVAVLTPRMQEFSESLQVETNNGPVLLALDSIEVDEIGNIELPRDTVITLGGAVPNNAEDLTLVWPAEYGALVLRQQGVPEPYTGYLEGGASSDVIALTGGDQASGWETFGTYIPVGFDHILPKGLDHILFVLALFFLSTQFTPLLWQVTSFTLAHSVTLAMAVLGIVNVPGSIVEPLIAASIVYVAVENVFSDKLSRLRPYVIFGFGLLHGLGFASVLSDFGLPEGQVIPALVGFNIGVELGQLTVIAIAFILVWYALRVDAGEANIAPAQGIYGALTLIFFALGFAANTAGFQEVMGASAMVFFWPLAALCALCIMSATLVDHIDAYRKFVAIPASAAIALVGAYWFVERVFL